MSVYQGIVDKLVEGLLAATGAADKTDAVHRANERVDADLSVAFLEAQYEQVELDIHEVDQVGEAKAHYAVAAIVNAINQGGSSSYMIGMFIKAAYIEGVLTGALAQAGLYPLEVEVHQEDAINAEHELVPAGGYIESGTGRAVRVLGVDRGEMVVFEKQLREPKPGDPGTVQNRYHVECFLRDHVRADGVPFL